MATDCLKILMLEDSSADAEMIQRLLKRNFNCQVKIIMSKAEYELALNEFKPGLIISDNEMPQFSAPEALAILNQQPVHVPFILVTGTVSEEFAASIIKAGADDYLLKDRLTRLPAAIEAALKQKQTTNEKLEAIERLQLSEEKYRSIMERVSDAFVALDKNWCYTYVNKKAGQILSRAPDNLIGKNIWTEFPDSIGNHFYNAYHTAMQNQQYIHLEEYYPAFDVWLENHIYPSPDGLSIYFRDITERKKAEASINKEKQLSETIINNLPGIFYLYDDTGKFIKWNKNFENVTGYNADEVVKMAPVDFYDEDEKERIKTRIKTVFEKESPGIEVEIFTKSKKKLPYFINSIAIEYQGKKCILGMGLDLSERKKAEEEIKNSEEKRRLIMTAALDAIICIDPNGMITFWNPQSEKIFGWQENEVIGRMLSEIIIPEPFRKMHEKGMENYLITGKGPALNVLLELKAINRQGKEFPIELTVLPIKQDGEEFFCAFVRDITGRKKAEEAIKASEEKYRVLVEQASDAIFITSPDGRFITANASACSLAQCTEQELLQMTVHDFTILEDITKQPLRLAELKDGKTTVTEREMKRKDGTVNYLEITAKLLTDGRLLAFVKDITERKKTEEAILISNERYNLVAKATNDSIWDFNIITGAISRTGDGFKTLFGHSTHQSGKDIFQAAKLIHPEDLLRVKESQQIVFNNPDEFYWEQEYRFLKASGEYAYVYDKGYIIRDVDGKAIRMIGATQDITKLRENEINLIKLNNDLQTQARALAVSNAELEQFAYVASHDMQEPLRMVTSFLILLEKNYGNSIDDKGKQYINYAVDGSKRMRQIILDLLELSKVGRKDGELELLDLNEVVREIQLIFQKELKEKTAFIEVGELPQVHAYKSSLQQVFQNLVGNAIKYKRKGIPVQIKIAALPLKDHWQFSIADNGIGIDKEYFDKIFVVFQRLHNKNEFSGTGIGLSITKKIIESLGGKIWLESEPKKGTTFYFTIQK